MIINWEDGEADNAQALGTITYLTADSTFGALGHGIHDTDTERAAAHIQGRTVFHQYSGCAERNNRRIPWRYGRDY